MTGIQKTEFVHFQIHNAHQQSEIVCPDKKFIIKPFIQLSEELCHRFIVLISFDHQLDRGFNRCHQQRSLHTMPGNISYIYYILRITQFDALKEIAPNSFARLIIRGKEQLVIQIYPFR